MSRVEKPSIALNGIASAHVRCNIISMHFLQQFQHDFTNGSRAQPHTHIVHIYDSLQNNTLFSPSLRSVLFPCSSRNQFADSISKRQPFELREIISHLFASRYKRTFVFSFHLIACLLKNIFVCIAKNCTFRWHLFTTRICLEDKLNCVHGHATRINHMQMMLQKILICSYFLPWKKC